jgi:hypothetical protein
VESPLDIQHDESRLTPPYSPAPLRGASNGFLMVS